MCFTVLWELEVLEPVVLLCFLELGVWSAGQQFRENVFSLREGAGWRRWRKFEAIARMAFREAPIFRNLGVCDRG